MMQQEYKGNGNKWKCPVVRLYLQEMLLCKAKSTMKSNGFKYQTLEQASNITQKYKDNILLTVTILLLH